MGACYSLAVLYKILNQLGVFFQLAFHFCQVLSHHQLHFQLFHSPASDVKSKWAIWHFMSWSSTFVTAKDGNSFSSVCINVHWHRITQSWVAGNNGRGNPEWGQRGGSHRVGRNSECWCGSSVGQLKGFVGGLVLVYIFGSFVPVLRTCVRESPIGHCHNGVLDVGFQPFSEFDHHGLWICISGFCYQFHKFVQIIVDGSGLLVVIGRFQFVDCCDIRVCRAEIFSELFSEFFPI